MYTLTAAWPRYIPQSVNAPATTPGDSFGAGLGRSAKERIAPIHSSYSDALWQAEQSRTEKQTL